MPSCQPNGAQRLTASLAGNGVRTVFALSGNQIMPIFDACLDQGQRILHVRHEAAAVHMADAWARLTGEVGVALLTAGPGFANALGAIYAARMSEAPVLVVSGHAPTARLGQGAFQEMPQAEMAAGVAKASWRVDRAEEVATAVGRALAIARGGRPGPVHLALPADVLVAPAADPGPADDDAEPDLGEVAAHDVLALLAAADRPLILHGPALCAPATEHRARRLEQATGIPVVGMESPRGLNDPALGAFAEVMAEADRVLLLGKAVDFSLGFAEPPHVAADARFLQIEPEAAQRARTKHLLGDRLMHTLAAAPLQAAAALTRAAPAQIGDDGWRRQVRAAIAHRPEAWAEIAAETAGTLHPVEIGRAVQTVLDAHPRAVLIVDGGEVGQWVQATTQCSRRLINGPAGGIGSALPFALAARLVEPDAPVIAVMGDGTIGFHLSEFETAAREHLPVVAVIGNDRRWNAEHQIQLATYGPDRLVGCELSSARYDQACAALGGSGWTVNRRDSLPRALADAVASGQPACLDVALDGRPAPKIRRAGPAASEASH
mgnify:CR=1 FL=1